MQKWQSPAELLDHAGISKSEVEKLTEGCPALHLFSSRSAFVHQETTKYSAVLDKSVLDTALEAMEMIEDELQEPVGLLQISSLTAETKCVRILHERVLDRVKTFRDGLKLDVPGNDTSGSFKNYCYFFSLVGKDLWGGANKARWTAAKIEKALEEVIDKSTTHKNQGGRFGNNIDTEGYYLRRPWDQPSAEQLSALVDAALSGRAVRLEDLLLPDGASAQSGPDSSITAGLRSVYGSSPGDRNIKSKLQMLLDLKEENKISSSQFYEEVSRLAKEPSTNGEGASHRANVYVSRCSI